jgi:hypothetical protein
VPETKSNSVALFYRREGDGGSGQDIAAGDVGDLSLFDEFGLVRGVEVGRDQRGGGWWRGGVRWK